MTEKIYKLGKVETYLNREIRDKGTILLSLADPDRLYTHNITPEDYARAAYKMSEAGVAANMLGGSTGVTEVGINEYAKKLKEYVKDKPVILFPSGPQTVAKEVDAVWFMSLRNSRDPYWIIIASVLGIPLIKRYNIEPIPMAYLIVEPGGTAGIIGDAVLIPRNEKGIEIAKMHALASQYSGFRWVYLEAGSGSPEPVPDEMIRGIRKVLDVHLGTGGGIRTAEQARSKAASGADYIFMGTRIEELIRTPGKIKENVEEIVEALKEGTKKRRFF